MSSMFDQWSLYARVVESGAIAHRDVSAAVREFLGDMDRPCRVLDLGCGDGWMARECLKSSQVSRYVGIDTFGRRHRPSGACPPRGSELDEARIDLFCEDVFTALPTLPSGEFDLVLRQLSVCTTSPSPRNSLFYARSDGCSLRREASSGPIW